MKDLNTVYFEGNPLEKKQRALYRNKVKLALPNIRQIDASKSFQEGYMEQRHYKRCHPTVTGLIMHLFV